MCVGVWYGNLIYIINIDDVYGNIKIKWYVDLCDCVNVVCVMFIDLE